MAGDLNLPLFNLRWLNQDSYGQKGYQVLAEELQVVQMWKFIIFLKLKYILQIRLYKFKVYNMLICLYIVI